jgi:hypothetical protein
MKTTVFTLSRDNYKPLRDITSLNKIEYCKRHNYSFEERLSDFKFSNLGFEKIYRSLELLENNKCDLLYWCGVDTLITNFSIKITDLIDTEHDFFVSTDANNINVDSFVIKNTKNSKEFFSNIISLYPKYANDAWAEQQVIIDLIAQHEHIKKMTKILPQKMINSYDYRLYPESNFHGSTNSLSHYRQGKDFYGNNGQWSQGDFLIHWPGTTLEQRMHLAKIYSAAIIYD